MAEYSLEVNGLTKRYGDFTAVDALTFKVEKGEIFAIMGPNGAGKSSTIESVIGTKSFNSGSVNILGMDSTKNRADLFKRVGVQFQDSSWQTAIKVSEICESIAVLYDPVPDWRSLLKKFDLEKRINSKAESLSGGEKQKLSILLASLHTPELLFLDELTTGLDPSARRATWKFIKKLQKGGMTIILTSHFMDEVEYLCDRGIILKDGVVVASGTIKEIINEGNGKNLEDSYLNIIEEENYEKNSNAV